MGWGEGQRRGDESTLQTEVGTGRESIGRDPICRSHRRGNQGDAAGSCWPAWSLLRASGDGGQGDAWLHSPDWPPAGSAWLEGPVQWWQAWPHHSGPPWSRQALDPISGTLTAMRHTWRTPQSGVKTGQTALRENSPQDRAADRLCLPPTPGSWSTCLYQEWGGGPKAIKLL